MPKTRIAELRKERGLTLMQLGALTRHPKTGLDAPAATLSKIELGVRDLTPGWRQSIAAALGVHPDELSLRDS